MSIDAANVGRLGVHVAGAIVEGQLGWRFREQHESDSGIDALVEIVSDGHPTGKLVALQIKAGQSWFQHRSHNGWTFYGTKRHRLYWLGHDLPVLVVLVDPRTGMAYWAHVTETDAEPTASAFKLNIPEHQLLGPSAARRIEQIRRLWQPMRCDRWSRARDTIASCRAVDIPVAPSAAMWAAFAAGLPEVGNRSFRAAWGAAVSAGVVDAVSWNRFGVRRRVLTPAAAFLVLGILVEVYSVQRGSGDLLLAGDDGVDGRFPDEMRQAADHSAGTFMQVTVEGKKRALPHRPRISQP